MRTLEGITVVSLEHAIAAPFASRHLADHGARVIKIERPDGGDFARRYDERARGQASHFVWVNRSKESVSLDLKSTSGKNALTRLVKHSDVFLQNLGPGVCDALGFGQKEIRGINPDCITCSISGYGSGGPLERRKAYDLLVQAESGLLSVTGTEEVPCKAGIAIADIAAGMYAFSCILSALLARHRGLQPPHIEISMLEALTEWMGHPLYYTLDGQPAPTRNGAAHATIFPYGPYRSKTGEQLLIAIQNDQEWQSFCSHVLDDPELASNPSYSTNTQRNSGRELLQRRISKILSDLSLGEMIQRLERAGVAFSELKEVTDVWAHPQLRARERLVEIDTPAGKMPAFLPPGMDSDSARMDRVPALGQDTARVLSQLEGE